MRIYHLSVTFIALVVLSSCGGGTDIGQPFSPGMFEGQPTEALSDDTERSARSSCRSLTSAFLADGKFRIRLEPDGEYIQVLHERKAGTERVALLDGQQTAFGIEEKISFTLSTAGDPEKECSFTFIGHFISTSSDIIQESGTIHGKCENEETSIECFFRQDMPLFKVQ